MSAASFQSAPTFSHTTTYFPVTSCGVGPLVFKLKVPIARAAEGPRGLHGVPYAFALTGAMLLCLAPDFRNPVEASLVFLAVTAMMHGSVIYGMRKGFSDSEGTVCAANT